MGVHFQRHAKNGVKKPRDTHTNGCTPYSVLRGPSVTMGCCGMRSVKVSRFHPPRPARRSPPAPQPISLVHLAFTASAGHPCVSSARCPPIAKAPGCFSFQVPSTGGQVTSTGRKNALGEESGRPERAGEKHNTLEPYVRYYAVVWVKRLLCASLPPSSYCCCCCCGGGGNTDKLLASAFAQGTITYLNFHHSCRVYRVPKTPTSSS